MTQFIEVIGHLGRDAEQRETPNGRRVVTLSLAVNTHSKGQDETTWWRCTIWGNEYDKMVPYLKQGTPLIIRGDMRKPSTYQSKDGSTQVSLELNVRSLNFLPKSKQTDQTQDTQGFTSSATTNFGFQGSQPTGQSNVSAVSEDDLPF